MIQVKPPCSFTPKEVDYLTNRIQNGGTEVVEVSNQLVFLLSSCYIFWKSYNDYIRY